MKHTCRLRLLLLAALPLSMGGQARADTSPLPFVSPLFTDDMVLQRGQSDAVWGWAAPGTAVTVRVAGKGAKGVAGTDGRWTAHLPPLPVGGPYALSIAGAASAGPAQSVTLRNVLVGDVWVCSGQSNMEFGMGMTRDADQEVGGATDPALRLFVTQKRVALSPQQTTTGQWLPCTPASVKRGTWNGFSAVGYFFGRSLRRNLHVPIGLIQTAWGGTPAEAWTSEPALAKSVPAFAGALAKNAVLRRGLAGRDALPPGADFNQNSPGALYNAMVSPLTRFGIKGVIWYQGEANAGRSAQYRTLLPAMIADWRAHWGQKQLPFLIVQLAGWGPGGDDYARLRQVQFDVARTVPGAGLATAVDVGDRDNIHPSDKQDVGQRLALVAEGKVYGERVEYSGPVYHALAVQGGQARVTFTHASGGLVSKGGGPLTGFTIATADGVFVPAQAVIQGASVLVSSPQVPVPVAVRYAWTGFPECSVYGRASALPALPFRTDSPARVPGLALPVGAGPDLALERPVVCSDPNTHGWNSGLTDGSWEAGTPTTFASNEADAFPKTITVELAKAAPVGLVAVGVPPFGSTKTVSVAVSADGISFRDVGTYVFSQRKEEKHLFHFAPTSARFVRLTYPDHYAEAEGYLPTFVFATELAAYAPNVPKRR